MDSRAAIIALGLLARVATAEELSGGRLYLHEFTNYTILLPTPAGEDWEASWNDPGQMAVFRQPTNDVVITAQFLRFPLDAELRAATGDRTKFLDLALRQYCAIQLARSYDPEVMRQPLHFQEQQLGGHYFRYAPILGQGKTGRRRGFFYMMLRGPADRPRFTGDVLVMTLGYPATLPPEAEQKARRLFEVMLQNISFQ